jgi:hypothetical protein
MSPNIESDTDNLKKEKENLKKECEKLKSKKAILEKEKRDEFKKNWSWWSSKVISALVLLYLAWILLAPSPLKPKEITNQDILLIAVIFLFNSGLLENLENLSVSGEGVAANFRKLEKEVDDNKKEIDALQQEQLENLGKQQAALISQQEMIGALQAEQALTLGFMYNLILDKKEFEKVYWLNKHYEQNSEFKFKYMPAVGQELRRLRSLGLIQNYPHTGVRDMENDSKNNRGSHLDLTKYFYVTDTGKKYLEMSEKLKTDLDPKQRLEIARSDETD